MPWLLAEIARHEAQVGRAAAARELLDRALAIEPAQPAALIQRAEMLRLERKPQPALALLRQGLEAHPG
jgi:predicted Zn-dependent protease